MPAQQLQQAADVMLAAAARGRSVAAALKRIATHVYRQITRDAHHPALLAVWGKSRNVDDNVGATIVPPAIVEAIGSLAGVPMRGVNVHAGLLHTYGYLFSSLQTPYGLKRDRWISKTLEQGFGLNTELLSDHPGSGTLLANVTWFFGQIAFRDRPAALRRIEAAAPIVAPELVRHDFRSYDVLRIVEQAEPAASLKRPVTFVTDLIPYPNAPAAAGTENTLLVYSVQIGAKSPRKLITGFPVRTEMVRTLLDAVPARSRTQVGPRYNAYVPGLPAGSTVPGRSALQPVEKS